jgi:hypothetical protein
MSPLALRKLMSALSYLSSSPVSIRAILDGSPSCSWIALRVTSLVAFIFVWFAFLVRISRPD